MSRTYHHTDLKMKTKQKNIINTFGALAVLWLCLLTGAKVTGQQITGPTAVDEGTTNNYYLSGASNISWNVSGAASWSGSGSSISVTAGSSNYTVSANFTGGPGYSALFVNVTPSGPPNPGNPTASTSNCEVTLTRTGSPTSGITWYWQGKDGAAEITTKGSGSTYVADEGSGRYYIKAKYDTGGWSAGTGYVDVTIPTTPSTPTFTGSNPREICAGQTTTLTVSSPISGTYRWYNSSGTQVGTGTSYAASPGSSTTYSARVTSSAGCESAAGTIQVDVIDLPAPLNNSPVRDCTSTSTVVLSAISSKTVDGEFHNDMVHVWYSDQTRSNIVSHVPASGVPSGSVGTQKTITLQVGQSASYWVASKVGNCEGDLVEVTGEYIDYSIDGGQISAPPSVVLCFDTDPGNMANATLATGGDGAFTYQWEYSDNNSSWFTIGGATSASYDPAETLLGNRWYRRKALSCNRFGYSNVIQVTVQPNVLKPDLQIVSQTSCSSPSGSFSITNYNAAYTYAVSPSTGVSINGDTVTAFQGTYTVTATHNGCSSQASDPIEIFEQPFVPGAPLSPTIDSTVCGEVTLTRDEPDPLADVTWYWQTQPTGTSTAAANSAASITLTSGTVYYLRAKHNTSNCWGDARTVDYTINQVPLEATGSTVSRCGPGTVTLAASPGTHGDEIRWYTVASGGTPLTTGVSGTTLEFTTPDLSANATYYVESYNSGTGCTSATRHAITAEVIPGLLWYADSDDDGFRDPASQGVLNCSDPGAGWTQNTEEDVCPSVFNAVNLVTTWYLDADNDDHAWDQTDSCVSPGSGWKLTPLPVDDCDDADPAITGETTWYEDEDDDGWGDPLNYITQCTVPVGYVSNNSDLCPMIYDTSNTCSGAGSGTLTADNYLYTRTYQSESLTASDFFTENDDLIQEIAYYDGLGRPAQQIGIDQTPTQHDIVTHITYDEYSRQHKEYLPYAVTDNDLGTYRSNALSGTNMYYSTPKYQNTANPYSEKEFEPSPLNRVLKQAAPGEDWKLVKNTDDHSIEFAYLTNIQNPNDANDPDNDDVRLFQVDLSGGDQNPVLAENGFYPEGELYKNVTKDENHDTVDGKLHTTEEFTDKQGRVVLKRTYADIDLNADGDTDDTGEEAEAPHDTYYVYDDHGNLTYVLPPKMEASTASLADINTHMAELGYQYVYDHRNRLVEKQLPGKGEEYIIYNTLDQPIMTQDANQRANSPDEWLFTKYDGLGRVAYTGIALETGDYSREQIQTEVDAFTDPLWVIQSSTDVTLGGTDIYYDDGAYPNNSTTPSVPRISLDEILTINYYDTYVDAPLGAPGSVNLLGSDPVEPSSDQLQGLPTVSRVKVLDVTGSNVWINTQTYYDAKGRVVQTYSDNTYLGTLDVVETQLDFIGKPVKVRTSHTRNGITLVTLDNFTYDPTGRLLAQTQCIGDSTLGEVCPSSGSLDADLLWDGLGTINSDTEATQSIIVRNADIVPGTSGTTLRIVSDMGQELIVYNDYDELGQLARKKVGGTPAGDYGTTSGLQEVDYTYNVRGWLTGINDISDAIPNKLFNFSLSYNQGPDPLYNGNISQTQWRTASMDNTLKSYGYTYDALDRITGATDNTGNYSLSNVAYDKNGNILTLDRQGLLSNNPTSNNYGLMDNLVYSYRPNSNRLMKVADGAADDQYGFKDDAVNTAVDSTDDFVYDQNGNMTFNDNKGITGIVYNHLNLPTNITVASSEHNGNVQITYAADGNKLKKMSSGGSSGTTEYAGNYIYENGTLRQFGHQEGYVEPEGSTYRYVYNYHDQIENVRLTYSDLDGNGSIDPGNEILHERNYYPFGLLHKGYNNNINGVVDNYQQYQDQEFTEDLGLNVHEWRFRFSDPAIARFWSIDPLAEQYSYQSPYNFSENRVIDAFELEGLEKVSIHNRAFAPFKTFGLGFSGDGADRGFTTSSTVTSRVSQTVDIDFNQSTPTVADGQQVSDLSHHPILGTDRAPVKKGLKNVQTGETSTGAKQVSFQTEIESANPLTDFGGPLNPNIDLDGAFSISSNQETGVLSISANITGDNFPAAESFISDSAGNSVFIGVSALQGNPRSGLPGEGGNERINNDLQINFNSDGVFQNVIYKGQQYNIQDYNKLFNTQNPNGN